MGDNKCTENIVRVLERLTSRLETLESNNSRSNNDNGNVKNNHESFALNQVVKYNGSNIKIWLSTVKSAFRSCGYSRFLESEILPDDSQYRSYENCLGTIRLMFESNKLEIIEHCKTVYEVWSYMAKIEKDTFATAVRKHMELTSCRYTSGPLRVWLETLTAKFEAVESDWCHYSDQHRCVVTLGMIRSIPKFEQLSDRITALQTCSMKDIMNAFIEYDENMKINSLTSKSTSDNREVAKMMRNRNKKQFKNNVQCSYCKKFGHQEKDCRFKFWDEKHKSSSSSTSSSVPSSSKSASSSSSSNNKSNGSNKQVAKSIITKNIDKSSNIWILDSGCTTHTTVDDKNLIDPEFKKIQFETASGETVESEKIGDVIIKPKANQQLILKNVAFGKFNSNLISIRQLTLDGYKIFLTHLTHTCSFLKSFFSKTKASSLGN
nr:uncharacterized protein LOC124500412 [Dermatophagoides farinae]